MYLIKNIKWLPIWVLDLFKVLYRNISYTFHILSKRSLLKIRIIWLSWLYAFYNIKKRFLIKNVYFKNSLNSKIDSNWYSVIINKFIYYITNLKVIFYEYYFLNKQLNNPVTLFKEITTWIRFLGQFIIFLFIQIPYNVIRRIIYFTTVCLFLPIFEFIYKILYLIFFGLIQRPILKLSHWFTFYVYLPWNKNESFKKIKNNINSFVFKLFNNKFFAILWIIILVPFDFIVKLVKGIFIFYIYPSFVNIWYIISDYLKDIYNSFKKWAFYNIYKYSFDHVYENYKDDERKLSMIRFFVRKFVIKILFQTKVKETVRKMARLELKEFHKDEVIEMASWIKVLLRYRRKYLPFFSKNLYYNIYMYLKNCFYTPDTDHWFSIRRSIRKLYIYISKTLILQPIYNFKKYIVSIILWNDSKLNIIKRVPNKIFNLKPWDRNFVNEIIIKISFSFLFYSLFVFFDKRFNTLYNVGDPYGVNERIKLYNEVSNDAFDWSEVYVKYMEQTNGMRIIDYGIWNTYPITLFLLSILFIAIISRKYRSILFPFLPKTFVDNIVDPYPEYLDRFDSLKADVFNNLNKKTKDYSFYDKEIYTKLEESTIDLTQITLKEFIKKRYSFAQLWSTHNELRSYVTDGRLYLKNIIYTYYFFRSYDQSINKYNNRWLRYINWEYSKLFNKIICEFSYVERAYGNVNRLIFIGMKSFIFPGDEEHEIPYRRKKGLKRAFRAHWWYDYKPFFEKMYLDDLKYGINIFRFKHQYMLKEITHNYIKKYNEYMPLVLESLGDWFFTEKWSSLKNKFNTLGPTFYLNRINQENVMVEDPFLENAIILYDLEDYNDDLEEQDFENDYTYSRIWGGGYNPYLISEEFVDIVFPYPETRNEDLSELILGVYKWFDPNWWKEFNRWNKKKYGIRWVLAIEVDNDYANIMKDMYYYDDRTAIGLRNPNMDFYRPNKFNIKRFTEWYSKIDWNLPDDAEEHNKNLDFIQIKKWINGRAYHKKKNKSTLFTNSVELLKRPFATYDWTDWDLPFKNKGIFLDNFHYYYKRNLTKLTRKKPLLSPIPNGYNSKMGFDEINNLHLWFIFGFLYYILIYWNFHWSLFVENNTWHLYRLHASDFYNNWLLFNNQGHLHDYWDRFWERYWPLWQLPAESRLTSGVMHQHWLGADFIKSFLSYYWALFCDLMVGWWWYIFAAGEKRMFQESINSYKWLMGQNLRWRDDLISLDKLDLVKENSNQLEGVNAMRIPYLNAPLIDSTVAERHPSVTWRPLVGWWHPKYFLYKYRVGTKKKNYWSLTKTIFKQFIYEIKTFKSYWRAAVVNRYISLKEGFYLSDPLIFIKESVFWRHFVHHWGGSISFFNNYVVNPEHPYDLQRNFRFIRWWVYQEKEIIIPKLSPSEKNDSIINKIIPFLNIHWLFQREVPYVWDYKFRNVLQDPNNIINFRDPNVIFNKELAKQYYNIVFTQYKFWFTFVLLAPILYWNIYFDWLPIKVYRFVWRNLIEDPSQHNFFFMDEDWIDYNEWDFDHSRMIDPRSLWIIQPDASFRGLSDINPYIDNEYHYSWHPKRILRHKLCQQANRIISKHINWWSRPELFMLAYSRHMNKALIHNWYKFEKYGAIQSMEDRIQYLFDNRYTKARDFFYDNYEMFSPTTLFGKVAWDPQVQKEWDEFGTTEDIDILKERNDVKMYLYKLRYYRVLIYLYYKNKK